MAKFVKKPIPVYAVQYDGSNHDEIGLDRSAVNNELFGIETLEGFMIASPGDWIITGIDGERYPCKPDIFKRTYEAVSETDDAQSWLCECPKLYDALDSLVEIDSPDQYRDPDEAFRAACQILRDNGYEISTHRHPGAEFKVAKGSWSKAGTDSTLVVALGIKHYARYGDK